LQQEENNKLKTQNEELSAKLRRAEVFLSRVKEDLARLRSSAGVKTSINFDEEQRLMIKLKVSYKKVMCCTPSSLITELKFNYLSE